MQAAKEWGLTPERWRACSIDDRARMMAHCWLESTREAYSAEGRMFNEKDKNGGSNNSGGMAQFQAMKEAMTPPPGWSQR